MSPKNLEKGNGAIPILLHDPQFGKAFTGNLQSLSASTSTRSRASSTRATGTAGKLINDPSLFDAANRLVVGVNESAILRWLIKDRQKSGHQEGIQRRVHAGTLEPIADAGCAAAVKLLVTGGAGFIGSHLADRRLARGRPGRRARRLQRLLRPGA